MNSLMLDEFCNRVKNKIIRERVLDPRKLAGDGNADLTPYYLTARYWTAIKHYYPSNAYVTPTYDDVRRAVVGRIPPQAGQEVIHEMTVTAISLLEYYSFITNKSLSVDYVSSIADRLLRF